MSIMLACPFCGGHNVTVRHVDAITFAAVCVCGARGKSFALPSYSRIRGHDIVQRLKGRATTAWNQRQ